MDSSTSFSLLSYSLLGHILWNIVFMGKAYFPSSLKEVIMFCLVTVHRKCIYWSSLEKKWCMTIHRKCKNLKDPSVKALSTVDRNLKVSIWWQIQLQWQKSMWGGYENMQRHWHPLRWCIDLKKCIWFVFHFSWIECYSQACVFCRKRLGRSKEKLLGEKRLELICKLLINQ